MKTNFLNQLACGAFAVMIAASFNLSAKAQGYINGTISFDGGALLDNPLGSATKFISIFGPGSDPLPEVLGGSQTGTYASPLVVAGTPATFPAFTFIPPAVNFPLWSFTFGGNNYSFQANTITFVYQNGAGNGFLDIAGTGTASISGYTDTPGTWSIVDTGQGSPVLTFGASTQVTPVPEPSAFALLASFVPVIGAFAYRAKAKA